ncbi:MFS transporter [Yoonia sp. BS5-3]|uniref:MFS transporter n=1 Tax=Yoonia phaeophyticola TaxID=3137369 RepID=A0ABZ2UYP3_9RHOB
MLCQQEQTISVPKNFLEHFPAPSVASVTVQSLEAAMANSLSKAALKASGPADRNKARHVISLSLSKTADELINPKLILTWLITALGAPAYLSGAVVPIREAGALLPQPLIARFVQRYQLRKMFWALGALLQGAAAFAIAMIALRVDGTLAGWLILLSLLLFVAGRSLASTTYKDALARTVEEGERGHITGWAGTVAAVAGLAFGASMALGVWGQVSVPVVAAAIGVSAVMFACASCVFIGLNEDASENKSEQIKSIVSFIKPLREDKDFRRYVLARAFLTATALAPPFIVLASAQSESNSLTTLGPLVIASGLAAIVSSAAWGYLSDTASRLSLAIGGGIATIAYAIAAFLILLEDGSLATLAAASILFVAQVGYQGVRSGRSIYLTDMANDRDRLQYTALSNILIGTVLAAGLGLAGVAEVFGAAFALAVCAAMSAVGVFFAFTLQELSK